MDFENIKGEEVHSVDRSAVVTGVTLLMCVLGVGMFVSAHFLRARKLLTIYKPDHSLGRMDVPSVRAVMFLQCWSLGGRKEDPQMIWLCLLK